MKSWQNSKSTLCKVPAHIEIEGNKAVDKLTKTIGIPGTITTRLSYAVYYLAIRRARNSWKKGSGKPLFVSYTTSKSGLAPTRTTGNFRSNWVYIISAIKDRHFVI